MIGLLLVLARAATLDEAWVAVETRSHEAAMASAQRAQTDLTPFRVAAGGQPWRGRPLLTGDGLYLPLIHAMTDGSGGSTGTELRVLVPEGR
jgi:hypothetical protein